MAFGDRLQEIRHSSGLTQEQFAEQLQVSRQAVSKWESGRGYPEIEKILYICQRYQVTPNELFGEEAGVEQAEEKTAQPEKSAHAEKAASRNLKTALTSFFYNLSPKNKWLGAATLLGIAVLSLLLGACLKGGTTNMMTMIWIGAIVVFGIAEAMTAGLVSIWFVIGSVAGLIAAICNGPLWLQITLFFVVSVLTLIATRPLVKKMVYKDNVATNADRVLGNMARVTEAIDNTIPTGAVYIDGKTWTARSANGEVIAVSEMVRVVKMEGVKLIVEK